MTAAPAQPRPQPLWIDAAGHACLVWWHAPAPAADPREAPALPRGWLPAGALPLVLVLASSWGEEDLSAYDGLRALAVAVAVGGIGVLRFEWPDSGDSSAATGTTTPADALAAFEAAATQARTLSGCDRLAFAGLRLGALLAAQAAQSRDDVVALVGLLPVASGRAFTGEQRLLPTGIAAPIRAPAPGSSFDAADLPVALGGFTLPVRALEAMAALRWPVAACTSVRDALLLGLPGPAAQGVPDALAQAGVRVREWTHDGLARALRPAHEASFAPEAIAEVVRWLQERAGDTASGDARSHGETARLEAATGAVLALAAAGARPWMRLRVGGVAVRERLVRLGDPRDREPPMLAGVLSEADLPPSPSTARTPRRGVVLLSAGRDRRVGPHRLWVPWARERAARGDVVLRLDLPGIGDSERHALADPTGRPEHDDARGVEAVARAAAWLRREHGVAGVTVVGLCSGAWHAWQAALAGVDVQQVVAVNPPIFHWRPAMWPDPRDDVSGARRLLRLRMRALARALGLPLQQDLAAGLVRVAAQGIAQDFVFARDEPGLPRWREEAGRAGVRLVRDSRVKVCEVAHADHTMVGTAGRAAFYACLDKLLPPPASMMSTPAAAPSLPSWIVQP